MAEQGATATQATVEREDSAARWLTWIGRGSLVIGVAAVAAALLVLPELQSEIGRSWSLLLAGDTAALRDHILGLGGWGPLASLALMIVQALAAPLPAFLVTFANGLAYGLAWGWLLSLVGHVVAALVAFGLARLLGRRALTAVVSERWLATADRWFAEWGAYAIVAARLLPGVSFDAVSYAAGLTRMNAGLFAAASLIGSAPQIFLYTYLGDRIPSALPLLLIFNGLLAAGVAAVLLLGRYRRP
jgi:uncharacterized membrane protein YdjX (TVP38/TMEM64 family)